MPRLAQVNPVSTVATPLAPVAGQVPATGRGSADPGRLTSPFIFLGSVPSDPTNIPDDGVCRIWYRFDIPELRARLGTTTHVIAPPPGGGSGSMTTVKEDGDQVGGADIVILDFLGADFDIGEAPDKEINIAIAAAIARVSALHAQAHTLASHSTKPHSALSDAPANAHHVGFVQADADALYALLNHALGTAHAADTLANLNSKVSDATLDDSGAPRPPNGAASGDLGGTYPSPTVDDGADATALHDDTAGEIDAIAIKGTPVDADLVVIEDSAATFAKKKATLGSLPSGIHGVAGHSGKIGEVPIAIVIPLKQPLPGVAVNAADQPLSAPFAFTGKKLKARARTAPGATITFDLTVAGVVKGTVSITSGALTGVADPADFAVAEDDELDLDQTAGGADDIAVAVTIVGEQDVSAAVA